jgi:phosphoribosyl 1,2-cyclic phosphate phosphodiesterase
VPLVGVGWGICDPNEPRNRRRRASILIEDENAAILVDSSPDCRQQLLDANVQRLDAVIYTHAHADHIHGIDDLRSINMATNAPLPAYGDANTLAALKNRFGYVFEPLKRFEGRPLLYYKPVLSPREIIGPFSVAGFNVTPFEQDHGFSTTVGLRIGKFAYSTDVVRLDDAAFEALDGVETWIVDCYRQQPHPTHAHLGQTLSWIERLRPERAIICHMGADMDYQTLCRDLPAGVEPAYDGMIIDI